jgi:hypothetical protein
MAVIILALPPGGARAAARAGAGAIVMSVPGMEG